MIITNFLVKKRKISQIDSIPYTGEDNIDTFKFEFDEEWEGLDKTLVIVSGSRRYNIALLRDECVVPFEFYQIKGNVLIGLFGTDGTNQTLATGWLPIYVEEDSYEVGVEPNNLPSQTQWDAFVTEINNLLEQAEASEEHCAEILAQMQEDYETYLASLNQIKDDTEELKNQTQTIKNDTNQIKTDVQGLKRQIEQDIADAELRIDEYNANATQKTNAFNQNASDKTNVFNSNATQKTSDYNDNASSKTTAYNDNATSKTNAYNDNATQKLTDYNDNATAKTTAFNENVEEKTVDFDEHTEEFQKTLDQLLNNTPTGTVIGDNLDITDAAGMKIKDIKVVGNTTQIQSTGKQMFDKDNYTSINSLYIHGTENKIYASNNVPKMIYLPCQPNTDYTIQKAAGKYFRVASTADIPENNASIISKQINDTGTSITINTGAGANYLCINYYHSNNDTDPQQYFLDTLMVELGDTAHDYEPYTNGQVIPAPTNPSPIVDTTGTQKVIVNGKNWFNETLLSQAEGYNTFNNNMWTTSSSTGYSRSILYSVTGAVSSRDITKLVKLLSGTYTIKFFDFINNTGSNTPIQLATFNDNGEHIENLTPGGSTITFTVANDCYLDIRRYVNSGTMSFSKIQIEKGTVATDYEQYGNLTTTLHLGDIHLRKIGDYQDKIYPENGKWWLATNVQEIVKNIANMNNDENYPGWLGNAIIKTDFPTANGALSNRTSYKTNIAVDDSGVYINAPSQIIYLGKSFFNLTQSQWKEQYPNLVFKLWYGKPAPFITEITDQTLIDELDALINMQTYRDNTTIEVTASTGNPAQLEVTYRKDLQKIVDQMALLDARLTLLEE